MSDMNTGGCQFELDPYRDGRCAQSAVAGTDWCARHTVTCCKACGQHATHLCLDAMSMGVCGQPLCDQHHHHDENPDVHLDGYGRMIAGPLHVTGMHSGTGVRMWNLGDGRCIVAVESAGPTVSMHLMGDQTVQVAERCTSDAEWPVQVVNGSRICDAILTTTPRVRGDMTRISVSDARSDATFTVSVLLEQAAFEQMHTWLRQVAEEASWTRP